MRLNVLSDLHLSASGLPHPRNDADAVVLAGDIARPREAAAWALGLDKPVFYVLGNHEFYGGSLQGTIDELKRLVAGSRVRVLDDEEVIFGGVRFVGSTLWTNFLLQGDGEAKAAAMAQAQRFMRDFSRITNDDTGAAFTPADSAERFARHASWLQRRLDTPHAGPTVVVTHHAPSRGSVHPRFAGSPLNASFVSDAEHLLGGERVRCWIHGHTHDSFDYLASGTRVVCNPRGYAKDGVAENARFDPDFVIDV